MEFMLENNRVTQVSLNECYVKCYKMVVGVLLFLFRFFVGFFFFGGVGVFFFFLFCGFFLGGIVVADVCGGLLSLSILSQV